MPGHGHGDDDHDEGEGEGEGENTELMADAVVELDHDEEHSEEKIVSDYEQDRWQLLAGYELDGQWFNKVTASFGYTDYEHAERHEEAEHEEATTM